MKLAESLPLRYFLGCVVVCTSVVGYFVGLQSPMRSPSTTVTEPADLSSRAAGRSANDAGLASHDSPLRVIPATSYAEMGIALNALYVPSSSNRFQPAPETGASVDSISPAEKSYAIAARDRNRAFNGAPPTVPHAIDQLSAKSCMACHSEGANTASLRISKMSHPYFSNCTQCHVEQQSVVLESIDFRDSRFVGLATPQAGPRASPVAPPQIPHATWMRNDCLSCHGKTANRGLKSTHPWRTSCLQCHTPSSEAEQLPLNPTPKFLPPLEVTSN